MTSLSDLARLRDARRRRASSYDTTGGNNDRWLLDPGETRTLAQIEGAGSVRHIWMTLMSREDAYPRRSVLRMYWDGAETPCVEAPTGDFFGIGHGITKNYASQPLTMSPQGGRAFETEVFRRLEHLTFDLGGHFHLVILSILQV